MDKNDLFECQSFLPCPHNLYKEKLIMLSDSVYLLPICFYCVCTEALLSKSVAIFRCLKSSQNQSLLALVSIRAVNCLGQHLPAMCVFDILHSWEWFVSGLGWMLRDTFGETVWSKSVVPVSHHGNLCQETTIWQILEYLLTNIPYIRLHRIWDCMYILLILFSSLNKNKAKRWHWYPFLSNQPCFHMVVTNHFDAIY